MNALLHRPRDIGRLLVLVVRSDRWRAALALAPIIPLSAGLSFLAARELLRALPADDTAAVTRGAVMFAVAFIGTVWLGRVVRTTRIQLGELAVAEFNRRRVDAVLAPAGVDHFERPDYLDKLETLRGRTFEVGQVPRMLGWLVDSGGGIAVSAALLFAVEPMLGLVVLGGVPAAIFNSRAQQRVERLNAANAQRNRRALHLYELATRPADAKEVHIWDLPDELVSRYSDEWRAADRTMLRGELRAGAIQAAGWLAQAAVFALGVAAVVRGVNQGTVPAADVFIALGAMGLVVGQFGQAAGGLSNLGRICRVFNDLAALEAESSATDRRNSVAPPGRLTQGITLHDVDFRYPAAATNALDGVTVQLPAGSVVALVGENGAGKSTMVKLLYALHQPTRGRITVDGTDLADIDPAAWRNRTAACFQDFLKLELTLLESVGAGDLPRIDDREAAGVAATRAGATELIEQLSEGFDTQVGPRLGGQELSGGQWQKVALSRAMMRDAPLLLALDEPTAALDPLAEQQLFQRYTDIARRYGQATGAITVLVAHRFSTVQMADLIIVLDQGRVREHGSHHGLLEHGDLYAELYELQAQHYR